MCIDIEIHNSISFTKWSFNKESRSNDCEPIYISDVKTREIKWNDTTNIQKYNSVLILYLFKYYQGDYDQTILSLIESLPKQIKVVKVHLYKTSQNPEKIIVRERLERSPQHIGNLLNKIKDVLGEKSETVELVVLKENEMDKQSYSENTKYTFKETNVLKEIPVVDSLVWDTKRRVPQVYQIPYGVKRITFIGINEPIPDVIPVSIRAVKFKQMNQCLSLFSFPYSVQYLSLDENFKQSIYDSRGVLHLPSSLSHLEITVDMDDPYHWLYELSTLPSKITHLKIHSLRETGTFKHILLIPSSVIALDVSDCLVKNIKLIDTDTYYHKNKDQHQHQDQPLSNLKSLKLPKNYKQIITNQSFPVGLETLDISNVQNIKDILDPSDLSFLLPCSLTSLTCSSPDMIPDHVRLNYLEYSIQPYVKKIVFKNTERQITRDKVPHSFIPRTSTLKPLPLLPIEEFETMAYCEDIIPPSPKVNIQQLNTMYVLSIPKSVEKLRITDFNQESFQKLKLPPNLTELETYYLEASVKIPKSLKSIKLLTCTYDPAIIPSSVTQLSIKVDENTISTLCRHNNNSPKYPPNGIIKIFSPHIIKSKSSLQTVLSYRDFKDCKNIGKNNMTAHASSQVPSFLKIWRNQYLQKKIYDYYYPTVITLSERNNENDINFITERFINVNLKLFNEYSVYRDRVPVVSNLDGFIFNAYGPKTHIPITPTIRYLETDYLVKIPDGPTHLKVSKGIKKSSMSGHELIPASVKHLHLAFQFIKYSMVPDTVYHLVIETADIVANAIPPSVQILEIKNSMKNNFTLDQYQDLIPSTVRTLILDEKDLRQEAFHNNSIPPCIANILSQAYHVYDSTRQTPLNTSVLIWPKNELILHGDIPFGVRRVIFGDEFNQFISQNSIPPSVTEINFGKHFDQCLSNIHLPISLKYLSFARFKRDLVKHSFPPLVSHLSINFVDGYPITNSIENLAESITHLDIKCDKLLYVPKFIKHLKVNTRYGGFGLNPFLNSIQSNQIISIYDKEEKESIDQGEQVEDPIPTDINNNNNNNNNCKKKVNIHLEFSSNFTQPILPGTLDHLNIKSITFGEWFNQALPIGSIPESVEKVIFSRESQFNQQLFRFENVTFLDLGFKFNLPLRKFMFPKTLKYLYLSECFNQPIKRNMLPKTLHSLYFGLKFNQPIQRDVLPRYLKVLSFGDEFKQKLSPGTIPNSVEQLSFGVNSILYPRSIPSSVRKLILKNPISTQTLIECVPNSVTELIIQEHKNEWTESVELEAKHLPQSLTILCIDHPKQTIYNIDHLPPTVTSLSLCNHLFKSKIPPSIIDLQLNGNFNKPIKHIIDY
ncbi:hypothetical protein CYY_000170 [Polysphondylium violaceum]|uniref:FNIP repeat-containing protein n=1 Tax=Polysphondylium violaceum TaxID=133409 RepID=A0A8J4Q2D8_9MYCE|nr:hypothetical protein CYY_000170 [Polysphondylium violaceum]